MKQDLSYYCASGALIQPLMDKGIEGRPEVATQLSNLALRFERELHIGAGEYERHKARDGYANGYKHKALKTGIGTLHLQIPQVRDSTRKFYPMGLERGLRSDRALKAAVAQMYIHGVATRSVQHIFKKLGQINITASQVSLAMKELDTELEKWRNRSIGHVKVLFINATYHKTRIDGVSVSIATFIVTGVLEDGHRSMRSATSGKRVNIAICQPSRIYKHGESIYRKNTCIVPFGLMIFIR